MMLVGRHDGKNYYTTELCIECIYANLSFNFSNFSVKLLSLVAVVGVVFFGEKPPSFSSRSSSPKTSGVLFSSSLVKTFSFGANYCRDCLTELFYLGKVLWVSGRIVLADNEVI